MKATRELMSDVLQNREVPGDGSVAAIIINYNGGTAIIECLRSLARQTYSNCQVVVVDNDSKDGSLEAVREHFPEVRIVETGYNAGWGVAGNAGINATDTEYVVMLNNDAYLDDRCIAEMVAAIRLRLDYGSCASRILLWDEPETIEAAGLVIYRDGLSVGRGRLRPMAEYAAPAEIFCANDCCCLYKRSMLREIGLYDPDFFIYADETDMGWRHQIAGWKCIYAPRAIAYHAHSRAAGSYSDFKAYHVERNRLYLCLKYLPVGMFLTSFFWAAYRYAMQVCVSRKGHGALARYRKEASLWKGVKVLLKVHADAFRMAPVMLRRRREYRSFRRLTDSEIAELFDQYGLTVRQVACYR